MYVLEIDEGECVVLCFNCQPSSILFPTLQPSLFPFLICGIKLRISHLCTSDRVIFQMISAGIHQKLSKMNSSRLLRMEAVQSLELNLGEKQF